MTLIYVVIVATAVLALDMAGVTRGPLFGGALFAINVVLMGVILFILDRGRLISPAHSRLDASGVDQLRSVSRDRIKLARKGT